MCPCNKQRKDENPNYGNKDRVWGKNVLGSILINNKIEEEIKTRMVQASPETSADFVPHNQTPTLQDNGFTHYYWTYRKKH